MEKQRYFLGANSPEGFYGYFQQAYSAGWRVWLLKGGPGTGKSTLMRQIVQEVPGEWEHIHCSSDPKSLDAVICTARKIMIVDATAPHSMEARRPGCVERLIDLGGAFDTVRLRRDIAEIDALFIENAAHHERAVHYLAAAAQVQRARITQAAAVLNTEEVTRLAQRCAAAQAERQETGEQRRRGLSAVTPDGIVFFKETIHATAEKVVLLNDDWGAAAPVFLSALQDQFVRQQVDMTVCSCSLFPKTKPEHILLPQKRVAYSTANVWHTAADAAENVELRDMYGASRPGTKEALERMLAQEKQLLEAASGCMYQARLVHDELEKYYSRATDFSFVRRKTTELIGSLQAEW